MKTVAFFLSKFPLQLALLSRFLQDYRFILVGGITRFTPLQSVRSSLPRGFTPSTHYNNSLTYKLSSILLVTYRGFFPGNAAFFGITHFLQIQDHYQEWFYLEKILQNEIHLSIGSFLAKLQIRFRILIRFHIGYQIAPEVAILV